MVNRKDIFPIFVIYFLGLIQGIAFTTVPAMANFLTSKSGFGFSLVEYGTLFTPMIIGAVGASFFGGLIAELWTIKNLLLVSIVSNVIAMTLIASSALQIQNQFFTYPLFLTAMGFLGMGFGGTITALNPFAVHFFPSYSSSALTALHSCLGIGTAIGPLSLSLFQSQGIWWAGPSLIALLFFILFVFGLAALPKTAPIESSDNQTASFTTSNLVWLFAIIALLYGITETTFGNWATIFLHQEKHLSEIDANFALSIFWGSVTLGRIVVTFLTLLVAPSIIFRILPFIVLGSILAIESIDSVGSSLFAFAIAGIGCSAFLPLTVNFGVKSYVKNPSFASGLIIATYMAGYGIAAQCIGFLHKAEGVTFYSVYIGLFVLVLFLGLFCFVSTKLLPKNHQLK